MRSNNLTESTIRKASKPAPRLTFSENDTSLIAEALRLASLDIRRTAETLRVRMPTSMMLETLATYSERMTDLLERIDAQEG